MSSAEPRKRTRTGCLNCSRRRRKCDEAKPTCAGCKRRGEKCNWRVLGAFRESNIKVLEPEHPSMKQSVNKKQNKFKILNFAPRKNQQKSPKTTDELPLDNDDAGDGPHEDADGNASLPPATLEDSCPPPNHPNFPNGTPSPASHDSISHSSHVQPYLSSPDDLMGLISHGSFSEPYPAIASPLFDHGVFSDPANVANDIFVPGSAYEALHTALRNRQLWTARSDIPSRGPSRGTSPDNIIPSETEPRPGRGFVLSSEREIILWQNYLNEICLWLDMFDNHRHFASTFPQMAKSAPHLRYSILALSARQMERREKAKSQSESLSLYQEAIHLLLPELESKTTPVIASCVILCVLEMLSCNPKEWRRHLDGCAYLIQAAEINGFSGKEEQALFWCFARMDVCGGLISEEETIIPIHNWTPKTMSPHEASQLFLASKANFDTYANYTVYLCAQTVGVVFGASKHHHPSCMSCHYLDGDTYVDRWMGLLDRVEGWYEQRPCQMKSIFSVSMPGGKESSFPTVIYGNGAASMFFLYPGYMVDANKQSLEINYTMYAHCCCYKGNQKHFRYPGSRNPSYGMLGKYALFPPPTPISSSGCWTNALQPLWVAGKAMSHHSEHAAIVETLNRIERETGWATAWRVEDLKEFWGDED